MARFFVTASNQFLTRPATVITGYPLSMAAWYRTDTAAVEKLLCAVGVAATNENQHYIALGSSGKVTATSRGGSGASAESTASYSTSNVWEHAAGTFISATSRFCFLDGTKGTENTVSKTPVGMDRSTIGVKANDSSGRPMDGAIAEAAIWNIVLTDEEIAAVASGV